MFIDKLTENFNINEPIFTEEILDLFKEYSRAQVFRYIDKAKENKKIPFPQANDFNKIREFTIFRIQPFGVICLL